MPGCHVTRPGDNTLLQLQREYLSSLPDRLESLRNEIRALKEGSADGTAELRSHLHRLAGSGGSYGFDQLSAIAREAERWLGQNPGSRDTAPLLSMVTRLEAAVHAAKAELEASASGEAPAVVPRALIIMRAGPQRERIAQELRAATYEVQFGQRQDDPASIPIEQLPHLVVIGGEAGDGDLSAIASTWTNSPDRRPGAVVLVETLRPVDRLRAIAAGVDAVFPAEQVEQKLPRYARTFARVGPPPSSILLVDHDQALALRLIGLLEQAQIRVSRSLPAQSVAESLERESPDLLLLNARLLDSDPFALVRMVRQDPRFHLLPIVFIGEDTSSNRIASLRSGADEFVPLGVDPAVFVQTIIARAARGRRLLRAPPASAPPPSA